MAYLEMADWPEREIPESRIYERSRWVRVLKKEAGVFFPEAALGDHVKQGETLGRIIDPLTDELHTVASSVSGEIIGMAFSRPVLSGYALYHVAWHTSE